MRDYTRNDIEIMRAALRGMFPRGRDITFEQREIEVEEELRENMRSGVDPQQLVRERGRFVEREYAKRNAARPVA